MPPEPRRAERATRRPALQRRLVAVGGIVGVTAALLSLRGERARATTARCPEDMALLEGRYCIDRYEASLERLDDAGNPIGAFPYSETVGSASVRAVSKAGVFPQAYVHQGDAKRACERAGKRLCSDPEWLSACRGATQTTWPYGTRFRSGYCNDDGVAPLREVFGRFHFDTVTMNDPRLNRVEGTVARTGSFSRCTSGNGVYDMVGNVHEWTAGGTFRGGFFLETKQLGEGCTYNTTAHPTDYHDYSTGFRCCADAAR